MSNELPLSQPVYKIFILIVWMAITGLIPFNLAAHQPDSLSRQFEDIFEIGSIQSLMIDVDSDVILEIFKGRIDANKPTNIKSASKSILSLLVGIAIEEGFLDDVDQSIGPFFEEYFSQNPNSRKESITIRQLLTMRTGLETTSFHNYGRWVLSDDWVSFVLDQPFVGEPGGNMVYSTGTSHLLSAILTKATGMSSRNFAQKKLFNPMAIELGGWDRAPEGYYMGGNNMALSPSSLLKIGRMVLDMGVYNGKQIVPENWIKESFQIYTRSRYNPYNYGYMWWRRTLNGVETVFAWGNGGQYIVIFPELNSVISVTSNLMQNNRSRRYQREFFNYLEQKMIPFLKEYREP